MDGSIKITIDDNVEEVARKLEGLEKDIKDFGGLEVKIKVKEEEIARASSQLDKLRASMEKKTELKFLLDNFLSDLNKGTVTIAQMRDTLGGLKDEDFSLMGKKMAEGFRKAKEELMNYEEFIKGGNFASVDSSMLVQGSSSKYESLASMLSGFSTSEMAQGLEKGAISAQRMENSLSRAVVSKQEMISKAEKLKEKTKNAGLEMLNLGKNIDLGNTKLGQGLAKLGRYAFALIGIRSIYLGLQRVANAWLNSGQEGASQLQSDLQSMMVALGSGLAPVIRWIVDHLALALGYVNELLKAFFGISLNASRMDKSMKRGAGGARAMNKELRKQLASFDEMNKLQDNTSSGGGGGGVSGIGENIKPFVIPAPDVTKLVEGIRKALEVLEDFWPVIATIGILFGAWKLMGVVKGLKDMGSVLGGVAGGFGKVMAGIIAVVAGVGIMMVSLGKLIFSWEELDTKGKIINALLAVLGAGLVAFGLILMGVTAPISILIAVIALLVVGIGILIAKLLTEKEAILSTEEASKNLEEAQRNLAEANSNYVDSVESSEEATRRLEEAEREAGMSGAELFSQVQKGVLDYKNMNEKQRELYKAYINNEEQQKKLEESTKALTEAKEKEKQASWDNELAVHSEAGSYDEFKKKVIEAMEAGELSTEEARDLMGKAMSGMSRDAQKTFMQDIPSDIKEGLDPKNYETSKQKISKWFGEVWEGIKDIFGNVSTWFKDTFSKAWEGVKNVFSTGGKIFDGIKEGIANTFKTGVNGIINGMNKVIRVPFNAINTALGKLRGVSLAGIKPFTWLPTINIPQIPQLAKGGIVVRPTQAIIGEAGKEAVLPLENNTEWLDMLADKLGGREMNISLVNVMDGDEISRKTFRHIKMKDLTSLGTLY